MNEGAPPRGRPTAAQEDGLPARSAALTLRGPRLTRADGVIGLLQQAGRLLFGWQTALRRELVDRLRQFAAEPRKQFLA